MTNSNNHTEKSPSAAVISGMVNCINSGSATNCTFIANCGEQLTTDEAVLIALFRTLTAEQQTDLINGAMELYHVKRT